MHTDLATQLNCPSRDCGSRSLRLEAARTELIPYRTGPVEEVREGALVCDGCGRRYPIEGYVPSFEQLFPEELREEARYWSDWYGFFWDRGYRGFFDLRAPMAPAIARGIEVLDPRSLGGQDLPGPHSMLAEHDLVRGAERLLDVGCGCGWSSLYLARRGHRVVAFDPSVGNVRRAKEYAISQGEYIEYLAAGLGFLQFEDGVFDGAFALHSIHHVPDLSREMAILSGWLREGGVIAVDEHVRDDPTLGAIAGEVDRWVREEIVPRHATLGLEALRSLPTSAHSAMEGAGNDEVMDALSSCFSVAYFNARFVSLDGLTFMYYLSRDRDEEGYAYAADVVHHIYRFLKGACPYRAEYVTLVGRKGDSPGPSTPDVAREMDAVLGQQAAPRAGVDTSPLHESIVELRATVHRLNDTLEAKNRHITHLESVIGRHEQAMAAQQATIARQAALLKRIEAGRVMRLLNRLTRR